MAYEVSVSPMPFVYEALPTRVTFGSGTRSALPAEIQRLGIARALILYGKSHSDVHQELKQTLGDRYAGAFDGARMHTPVDVTEAVLRKVDEQGVDGVVALGGGSTTGLAKAIALRTDLPQVILPTTYAGSEMTPILGETRDGLKTTQRSLKVLPEAVIYDVDLTMELPVGLSGVSGMNAIAHAVEALYAREANPIISALALQSVKALARALPAISADPGDRRARTDALYGAWLAGICLGSVGMALHHKLCHTLGGTFDLPHAQTHAVVLPHALAFNAPAVPQVMAQLCEALGVQRDAPGALQAINRAVGAPAGLAVLGMPREGIARAVELALDHPYWNPQPLAREGLTQLISDAYDGAEPRAYA
ncbi:maleylacetate reductase [Bordetella sp. FB-8]|uniref:maleylacetate reductase n=1 Tax=Bordetella sp. FB-8 TaxID=1159870 RepID=UPI00039A6007|nr:maleylacetate reductase [Bordetella sp. FB-8]